MSETTKRLKKKVPSRLSAAAKLAIVCAIALSGALAVPSAVMAQDACNDPCCRGEDVLTRVSIASTQAAKDKIQKDRTDADNAMAAARDCLERIKEMFMGMIPGVPGLSPAGILQNLANKACQAVSTQVNDVTSQVTAARQAAINNIFSGISSVSIGGGAGKVGLGSVVNVNQGTTGAGSVLAPGVQSGATDGAAAVECQLFKVGC